MHRESNVPHRRKLHTLVRVTRLAASILPLAAVLATCATIEVSIESITPDKVLAGSAGFTLTVKTTLPLTQDDDPEVLFNGQARPGALVDSHTVTAPISAAELTSPGIVEVALRYNYNADPSALDLRVTQPVSFTIEPGYVRIEITPSDTTVEVGDSVVYRAEAVRSDGSRVDVTSEMVFNSSQSGVATMDIDVAHAVAPGQTMITGAHISGTPVTTASLTVAGGGGGGTTVQFVIGPIGATSLDVGCYDMTNGTFTMPTSVDVGASVTDFTYVQDVDAYVMMTTSDVEVWTPEPNCEIKFANSKTYSNLSAYRDLKVLPAGYSAVASGNTLQGNDVGVWEVTPTYQISELLHIPATGGAVRGIGISQEAGDLAFAFRAGTTTQVWKTSSWPPTSSSWVTGGPISVSPSINTWGRDGTYTNVIGSGSIVQAFHVDFANLNLMPIGSPLATATPVSKTVPVGSSCLAALLLSGNSVPMYSIGSNGGLAAETPATLPEAEFVDDAVAFPVGVVFGIETPTGQQGVKYVRASSGCQVDTSVPALPTSGSGFANIAASMR